MKFSYDKKYHVENKNGKLVPGSFLFFKNTLYVTRASRPQLGFNTI